MSTIWALIVCLYGGNGTDAGVSCVLMPSSFVSFAACKEARDEVIKQSGNALGQWRATCVRQRSFP